MKKRKSLIQEISEKAINIGQTKSYITIQGLIIKEMRRYDNIDIKNAFTKLFYRIEKEIHKL
jgi:hypothetical protein